MIEVEVMIRKIALPAMLLAALDLAIKLLPLGEERTLIPGFLGLTSASNRGVAFGMLSGSPLINALLIGLVIILASIWLIKNPPAAFQAAAQPCCWAAQPATCWIACFMAL
jgi:lipoprotein signal peptidase